MRPPYRRLVSSAAPAALLLGALASGLAAQETLRVPKDFATIQAAVDAASNGDTIVIKKGVYSEAVLVDGFEGLTIVGKGRPVLQGGAIAEGGAGTLAITNSSDVLVRGLVARFSGGDPSFSVANSSGVTLEKCRVEDAVFADGIGVFSSDDVTLDRCRVTGSPDFDFEFEEGDLVTGVSIASSTNVLVSRTKVRDVGEDGISVASSGPVTLEKCVIRFVGDDGVDGSSNTMGGLLLVDRCRLADIGDDGIDTSGPMTDLHVIKTRIQRTGDDGVECFARAVTLEKVAVSDVDDDGIVCAPIATVPTIAEGGGVAGPVLIFDSRVLRAEDEGLVLTADGAEVDGLKLVKLEGDGVRLDSSSGVTLNDVRLRKIDGTAVELDDTDDSEFTLVRVTQAGDGVVVDSQSSGNHFEDVVIKATDDEGFDISGPNNEFVGNKVAKAGGYGFRVSSSGNVFTGNKASKSGSADLRDTAGEGANTYTDNDFGTQEFP